jgi:hypothetical protein
MRAVLWVMAVLSHWTVIHRVYHTRDELERADVQPSGPVAPSDSGTAAPKAGEAAGTDGEYLGARRITRR